MARRVRIGVGLVALAAASFGVALSPPVADELGYATPFSVPSSVGYRGRDYVGPSCVTRQEARRRGDLPLRRVGSVAGFLTGGLPLLLPRSELDSLSAPARSIRATPVALYVQAHCLLIYGLSGGP